MENSGFLFKRTFHPAPAVRPSSATLKRNRFDQVVIRGRSVLESNEVAARAIEFLTLG
jgi:hypothetical protein